METKPYNLQAPEQIAKEYAGNKQKIGQAAKMGLLDPTAAVLAGMFIDRMRSAQMQEQGPQQTVAQQVLSPTVPPMSPQAPGAPPPGAPPQAGLGAIAPQGGGMAPPPPQGPVGMAAGGYVGDENFGSSMVNGNYGSMGAPFNVGQSQQSNGAMFSNGMPQDGGNETFNNGLPRSSGGYAGGGLSAIDLPPEMFDEPRNGGFNNGFNNSYAGGGIVAFGPGGYVDEEEPLTPESYLSGIDKFRPMVEGMYGMPGGPGSAFAEQQAALAEARSPGADAKQKKEDMWMALAEIGANMAATKSPSFMQAAGEAARTALPGVAAAAKARKQDKKEALKQSVDMELAQFGFRAKSAEGAIRLNDDFQRALDAGKTREQALKIAIMNNETNLKQIAATREGNLLQASTSRQNSKDSLAASQTALKAQHIVAANEKADVATEEAFRIGGSQYNAYAKARKKDAKEGTNTAETMITNYFNSKRDRYLRLDLTTGEPVSKGSSNIMSRADAIVAGKPAGKDSQ